MPDFAFSPNTIYGPQKRPTISILRDAVGGMNRVLNAPMVRGRSGAAIPSDLPQIKALQPSPYKADIGEEA